MQGQVGGCGEVNLEWLTQARGDLSFCLPFWPEGRSATSQQWRTAAPGPGSVAAGGSLEAGRMAPQVDGMALGMVTLESMEIVETTETMESLEIRSLESLEIRSLESSPPSGHAGGL